MSTNITAPITLPPAIEITAPLTFGWIGPSGPNSVTSATTSNGTANLAVSSISVTGEFGSASMGADSGIQVITRPISTTGDVAPISTSGSDSDITAYNSSIVTGLTFKFGTSGSVTTLTATRSANRAIVFPDASGTVVLGGGTASGTNTGDQTTVSGNAGTATALQTSRNIFGLAFNGTANVAGNATNTGHFASIPTGGAAGHFVTLNGTAPTVVAGRSAWWSDGSGNPSFRNGTGTAVTIVKSSDLGTGVSTALGNAADGAGGFVTDSGTVANALYADNAAYAVNASLASEVPLGGVTGLGTGVATALAINVGSTGAVVMSNSTDNLTNKTLTSPAINSATFGTAATFNATSYTFGAGAAAAMNTALGLVSNADTLTSVYDWTKATGDYTATNVGTGTSSTATNVMQLNTLATAGSSALLRSDANDFRAWQKYSGSRQAVDWSKKTMHFVRISSDVFTGADTIFRIYLGLPSTLTTVQDLQSANTAIGFKIIAGEIFVQVSNGSAVTTTTTGVTMSAWLVYDCIIQSNGNGTWTATVNSTTVTGSGAPSATSAASNAALIMSATNGTTAAARRFFINNQKSMQYD